MNQCSEKKPFANLDDLINLWRAPERGENEKAYYLLPVVSDCLRAEAEKVGKDLDKIVENNSYMASVAKSVTVDVVARTLMTSTDQEPMTQIAQSAGGYSASGTLLVPGGGLYIKRSELARLGLRRQKAGGKDFYGFSD